MMRTKKVAHTHVYVYGKHPNKRWESDSVACVVCGFRIPKTLLAAALAQGAKVAP